MSLFVKGVSVHSGLSGLTADDHTQYTLLAGRSGGQTIIGGTDTGDDLIFKANSTDANPRMLMNGNSSIQLIMPTGIGVAYFDPAVAFMTFQRTNSSYTTNGTTGNAFTFDMDTVNTGRAVFIKTGALTSGNSLQIDVDSDIVTTGKAINVLSGSAIDTSVFSVDEDGLTRVQEALELGNFAEGGTARMNARAKHDVVSLAILADTAISIPAGALLLGASFNVDLAVEDDGGNDTWSAAYITGSTTSLASGAAAAQNTKADTLIVPEVASGTTEIRFTPNGGSFTAGIIEVVAYYIDLTSLADA